MKLKFRTSIRLLVLWFRLLFDKVLEGLRKFNLALAAKKKKKHRAWAPTPFFLPLHISVPDLLRTFGLHVLLLLLLRTNVRYRCIPKNLQSDRINLPNEGDKGSSATRNRERRTVSLLLPLHHHLPLLPRTQAGIGRTHDLIDGKRKIKKRRHSNGRIARVLRVDLREVWVMCIA